MHEELAVLKADDGRADVDADIDKCLGLGEGGEEKTTRSVYLRFVSTLT